MRNHQRSIPGPRPRAYKHLVSFFCTVLCRLWESSMVIGGCTSAITYRAGDRRCISRRASALVLYLLWLNKGVLNVMCESPLCAMAMCRMCHSKDGSIFSKSDQIKQHAQATCNQRGPDALGAHLRPGRHGSHSVWHRADTAGEDDGRCHGAGVGCRGTMTPCDYQFCSWENEPEAKCRATHRDESEHAPYHEGGQPPAARQL